MSDPIHLTFVLRPPAGSVAIAEQLLAGTFDPQTLKPSDLSADASEVQAIRHFAGSHGLQVESVDPAARTMKVSGSVEAIEKAFDISGVAARDYHGPIHLPPDLKNIVIAVLGLDQRPIARPRGAAQ